ncbi:MAG: PHP domain-containing protein, partial [Nitrososphaerales archaeon]
MNQVDLHTHTTASDGSFAPAQLVYRASRLGLKVMAVTDHDTVAGVREAQAAGAAAGVEVIAGVEINTDVPSAEVHV